MEKRYVIYRHLKPNGETFYIGIGAKRRAFAKESRNSFWNNIVSKYKYEVQILKSDLTWEDACELEITLINWYGRRDIGTGILANMSDGGEGSPGHIVSAETREKQRQAKLGMKFSKERCDAMSKARIGKKMSLESRINSSKARIGMKFSEEHKLNLGKSKSKKIINTETNEIYESAKELQKHLGLSYNYILGQLNGRLKSYIPYKYL